MNVARGIRAPLKIDNVTLEGNFGHFARVQVDVDLSKELPESKEKDKFFTHVEYRNILLFCKHCKVPPTSAKNDPKLVYRRKSILNMSLIEAPHVADSMIDPVENSKELTPNPLRMIPLLTSMNTCRLSCPTVRLHPYLVF